MIKLPPPKIFARKAEDSPKISQASESFKMVTNPRNEMLELAKRYQFTPQPPQVTNDYFYTPMMLGRSSKMHQPRSVTGASLNKEQNSYISKSRKQTLIQSKLFLIVSTFFRSSYKKSFSSQRLELILGVKNLAYPNDKE